MRVHAASAVRMFKGRAGAEADIRNGYGNDVPEFTAECSIREDYGNPNWGAEKGKKYYVLSIHKIYNVRV